MKPPAPGEYTLSLADYLAIDRTTLSNERTMLAYLRTALQLVVAGVSLLKFFDDAGAFAMGCALIAAGLAFLIVGAVLFVRRRNALAVTGNRRRRSRGI